MYNISTTQTSSQKIGTSVISRRNSTANVSTTSNFGSSTVPNSGVSVIRKSQNVAIATVSGNNVGVSVIPKRNTTIVHATPSTKIAEDVIENGNVGVSVISGKRAVPFTMTADLTTFKKIESETARATGTEKKLPGFENTGMSMQVVVDFLNIYFQVCVLLGKKHHEVTDNNAEDFLYALGVIKTILLDVCKNSNNNSVGDETKPIGMPQIHIVAKKFPMLEILLGSFFRIYQSEEVKFHLWVAQPLDNAPSPVKQKNDGDDLGTFTLTSFAQKKGYLTELISCDKYRDMDRNGRTQNTYPVLKYYHAADNFETYTLEPPGRNKVQRKKCIFSKSDSGKISMYLENQTTIC